MIKFCDRALIGKTKKTQEGYLIATSRVARTGIQEYRAFELGDVAKDRDPMSIVKVSRPESEVFSNDSIKSLSRVPVTINHPSIPVTSDNWKDLAVGEVGDGVMRDGDWLVVQPMIKDADALVAASDTHKEISMGYTAELRDAPSDSGADYEMHNLRFNHLALVPKGRAGSQARLADEWGASPVIVKDQNMTVELKTVVLGDKAVQVEAKDADTVAAILKDHKTAIDAKDREIGELTAKLDAAEAKVLSDEAIAELVNAKVKANTERAAVKAKIGDKADNMSDAQIEGAFLALGDSIAVDDTGRKAIADAEPVKDAAALIADSINKRFNKGA